MVSKQTQKKKKTTDMVLKKNAKRTENKSNETVLKGARVIRCFPHKN